MYKTAKQSDPDLNVIVITGYPDSDILDQILHGSVSNTLKYRSSPVTVLKKPLHYPIPDARDRVWIIFFSSLSGLS
jgi:hypothetical protein